MNLRDDPMIRVAVCMAGELRCLEDTYHDILRFYKSTPNMQVDFFLATKQTHTVNPLNVDASRVVGDNSLNIHEITNGRIPFKDIYISPIDSDEQEDIWISDYHAKRIKCEYEKAHNFRYDFVVKTRSDIVYHPHGTFYDGLVHIYTNFIYSELDTRKILFSTSITETDPDVFDIYDAHFFGTNSAMDIFMDYCNLLNCKWEELYYRAISDGIFLHQLEKSPQFDWAIVRQYQSDIVSDLIGTGNPGVFRLLVREFLNHTYVYDPKDAL